MNDFRCEVRTNDSFLPRTSPKQSAAEAQNKPSTATRFMASSPAVYKPVLSLCSLPRLRPRGSTPSSPPSPSLPLLTRCAARCSPSACSPSSRPRRRPSPSPRAGPPLVRPYLLDRFRTKNRWFFGVYYPFNSSSGCRTKIPAVSALNRLGLRATFSTKGYR